MMLHVLWLPWIFSSGLSTDDKFSRLSTHVFHGISCETPVEDLYELGAEIGKGARWSQLAWI